MKIPLLAVLAGTMLAASSLGEDLVSPKPAPGRLCRVLLYVSGSNRALDYPDVMKVHARTDSSITFETADGYIVMHQGPFTLIGPKGEFADHAAAGGRSRFFEAK